MPHDPVFLVFWLVSFLPLDDGIKYAFLQMRSQYQRMQTLDAVLRLGERFAEPGSRGAGGGWHPRDGGDDDEEGGGGGDDEGGDEGRRPRPVFGADDDEDGQD